MKLTAAVQLQENKKWKYLFPEYDVKEWSLWFSNNDPISTNKVSRQEKVLALKCLSSSETH